MLSYDILVLTDPQMGYSGLAVLKNNWQQEMNKFNSWCIRSEKRGILILAKKSCGVNYDNIVELDNSTAIMDLIMPDGLIINTLAVYGPSHEDDSKYWVKVRKSLDERGRQTPDLSLETLTPHWILTGIQLIMLVILTQKSDPF